MDAEVAWITFSNIIATKDQICEEQEQQGNNEMQIVERRKFGVDCRKFKTNVCG